MSYTITPIKPWWGGDRRVEPFMGDVHKALDQSGIEGIKRTEIYNAAYIAVYEAIKQYDGEGK